MGSLLPGLLLSALVAVVAVAIAPVIAKAVSIPAMVIALLIGILLNPVARGPSFQPGIAFALKVVLRWAVALLGLRIALGEIIALGWLTAALVIVSMAATLGAGFMLARLFALERGYGALAGMGTAVCGASATLATSLVMPDYEGKERDVVFVVVAVNALSTVAMVLYPLAGLALGFDQQSMGVLLGGTIHDVAQVVGAGYAVSETAGNIAVIVKLFRVLLMLPAVLCIGWLFARRGVATAASRLPMPVFAFAFVGFCLINSAAPALPAMAPAFALLKAPLVELSTWGLLIAIAALGLATSPAAMAALGWRHAATVIGTTLLLLGLVTAGLLLTR